MQCLIWTQKYEKRQNSEKKLRESYHEVENYYTNPYLIPIPFPKLVSVEVSFIRDATGVGTKQRSRKGMNLEWANRSLSARISCIYSS